MRDDNRYEYNMDVSRTLAQRGAGAAAAAAAAMTQQQHMGSSPLAQQYPPEISLLGSGAGGMPTTTTTTSYRAGGGGGGYPTVGTKHAGGYYYSMGAADLADAYGADGSGVDYGLGPYQVMSSDPVPMPAVASGYGQWPRPKSTTQQYLDSDSGYGSYGPASNNTSSLVHRPAAVVSSVAGDSSPYSFSAFAASLPTTAPGAASNNSSNERLLPTPVSRGANGAGGCYGAAPTNNSTKSGHPSPSGVVVGVGPTGISGGSPTSPLSEVTGYATSASSAYDYAARPSSHTHPHHTHHHQQYQHASAAGGAETIFGDADRSAGHQGPAVDLSGYTYGPATTGAPASPADSSSLRRASSGSGLTSRSTAESSTSSVSYGQAAGGSDGGGGPPAVLAATGPYQQQQHHHHSSSASHHHGASSTHHHSSSPRHHHQHQHHQHHISEQQQQYQRGVVVAAGSTAYGSTTGSNGIPGGGHTTAVADSSSRRPSVATRR